MPPLELKFLTEDARLVELARLYWELDGEEKAFPHSLKELAPKFSLPAAKIPKTVLEICEASSPVVVCEACGRARSYRSRSEYQEAQRQYDSCDWWRCGECYREEERRRREKKEEEREIAARQALALRRRRTEVIEETYKRQGERDYLLPAELSLTTAVYLLSCMRAGGPVRAHDFTESGANDDDFGSDTFSPRIIKNISPTKALDEEILDRLMSRGLIAVSPASEVEAFEFDEDIITGYDPGRVLWDVLPDVLAEGRPAFTHEVEGRLTRQECKTWRDEWPPLWRKIAAAECVQFLVHTLESYGHSYAPDAQATGLFSDLIDNYSAAQIFSLTHRAAKNFVAYERQVGRSMRPARLVEQIKRDEAFFRSQGWTVYAFRSRPAFPPQSAVSRIFFNTALGIGDDGFFKAPKDVDLFKAAGEQKIT